MGKRRASIDSTQLGFTFGPLALASAPSELAGLDRMIAATVALALKEDVRSREIVAACMSELLGESVTKLMLDAYASEAREGHNISAARAMALIAVTKRFDLLDMLLRRIGAALIVGPDMDAVRLGHLQAQREKIDKEIRLLRGRARPIGGHAA